MLIKFFWYQQFFKYLLTKQDKHKLSIPQQLQLKIQIN